jgi:hypothetical protein
MPRLKTTRGVLSKGSSGSSKKSSSSGNDSEELQKLSITEEGFNTAILLPPGLWPSATKCPFLLPQLGHQAPCETQASDSSSPATRAAPSHRPSRYVGVLLPQFAPRPPRPLSEPPLPFLYGASRPPLHLPSQRALGMLPRPEARGKQGISSFVRILLLVRRAGHKHAGVGAPAPQFVKVACYTYP